MNQWLSLACLTICLTFQMCELAPSVAEDIAKM